MSKPRILIVIYSLGGGGGEKALVNMLNLLPKDNYDIELQLFERKGINLQFVPVWIRIREPLFPNGMLTSKQQIKLTLKGKKIRTLIKKVYYLLKAYKANAREKALYAWKVLQTFCQPNDEEYDIVISGMHGLSTYYAIDCIKAKRRISWVHTDYSKIPFVKEDFAYFAKSDYVVTVSEQCQVALRNTFPQLQNVKLLHNLNCPEKIQDMASEMTKEECFPNNKEFCFVSIGRLIHLKGFDMALEAAVILKRKGVSFEWNIIGEGELKKELEKTAKDRNVYDEIRFIGAKQNPYPYIRNADILIQPSRYEGKSMVLDEAKILCKPIVVTAYDSVGDQITDRQNGIIVDITSEAIAEGILLLVENQAVSNSIVQHLTSHQENQIEVLRQYEDLLLN